MCRVTMGHLRVTIGHLRVTVGLPRVTMGHLRLTIGYLKATVVHIRLTLGHLRVNIGNFFLEANIKQTCLLFKIKTVGGRDRTDGYLDCHPSPQLELPSSCVSVMCDLGSIRHWL